jgi:hypothetical protein
MAKVMYYTNEEMAKAKMGGFKKKKPKKPKSKTERSISNYIDKYNNWVKELKSKAKEGKKLYDLKQALTKCK